MAKPNHTLDIQPALGEKIRYYRELRGFSQAKLAKLSGISRHAIVAYEHHQRMPGWSAVCRIADALGIGRGCLWSVEPAPDYREEDS